ncbi:fasciclin domain-containing protein, partial [Oleiphilus sp. HI0067]
GFDENNIGAVEGLQDILLQHVLGSEVSALAAYAANGSDVATLREGSSVSVEISNGDLLIEGAKVIETDIKASNGTIHLIDSVILSTN